MLVAPRSRVLAAALVPLLPYPSYLILAVEGFRCFLQFFQLLGDAFRHVNATEEMDGTDLLTELNTWID